jgi:chromosome partition protein MukF
MAAPSEDPHRLLAGLHRDGVSLELNTLDVCFLAALQLRAEQDGLASFEEEVVFDVFEQVCDLVEPGLENSRKRATHTIQRLRGQRLVARVDGTGIVSAGEYSLTNLANVIVKSFLEDEQLTRESLSLLTGAVISSLGQVRAAAQRANGESAWRGEVLAPLRITVGDLVGGIERRQRGLDSQQEHVQQQISELLKEDWFGVVEQCQSLLDTTAGTLHELNEVLLRDSSQIQSLLLEIQQSAAMAQAVEVEEAAQRVAEQVDRMVAWGASRQKAWSGYYQYVHRFLRDVVRLDPDRALSQRLLEQVRAWPSRPFAMLAAADARIQVLRPLSARRQRSSVGRPREDREREPDVDLASNSGCDLERLVRDAFSAGVTDLASLTRRILPGITEADRYRCIGRIAAIVARLRMTHSERDRAWVAVTDLVEIEDWSIDESERAAQR